MGERLSWIRGPAVVGCPWDSCAGWFLSTWHNLACFHRTGLQACPCSIFLTNDWCGRVQSVLYDRRERESWASHGQQACKQCSSVVSQSVLASRFLSLGSCLSSPSWWTVARKPFPPQAALGNGIYHRLLPAANIWAPSHSWEAGVKACRRH